MVLRPFPFAPWISERKEGAGEERTDRQMERKIETKIEIDRYIYIEREREGERGSE